MGTPYPEPITPEKTRIGWIGIGVMGAAMAGRLLSAGYSVSIYARSPSKALPLVSLGAELSSSPADLARSCNIVFTMLSRPQDVRQIVDSLLPSLSPNSVLIDHTSSHPDLATEIASAAASKACWAVDAPVSGGDLGAQTGSLSIFAGGDRGVVTWLSPLFDITGSKVTYMGGSGSGQSCKIANQIVVGGSLLGLSEGLFFADKAGLDMERWLEAVRGGAAGSSAMELFGKRIVERDFKPGGFAEYMVKDLGMGELSCLALPCVSSSTLPWWLMEMASLVVRPLSPSFTGSMATKIHRTLLLHHLLLCCLLVSVLAHTMSRQASFWQHNNE